MPKYDVSVVLHFEAEAPNVTEAKGRLVGMRIHKLLKGADLEEGLIYRSRELIKVLTIKE